MAPKGHQGRPSGGSDTGAEPRRGLELPKAGNGGRASLGRGQQGKGREAGSVQRVGGQGWLVGLKPSAVGQMKGGGEGRWVCRAVPGSRRGTYQSVGFFQRLEWRSFFPWGDKVSSVSFLPLGLHRVTLILSPDAVSRALSWRRCPQVPSYALKSLSFLFPSCITVFCFSDTFFAQGRLHRTCPPSLPPTGVF